MLNCCVEYTLGYIGPYAMFGSLQGEQRIREEKRWNSYHLLYLDFLMNNREGGRGIGVTYLIWL